MAYTSSMRVASTLDILVARGLCREDEVREGKCALVRIVPMILGLRGYLSQDDAEAEGSGL